MLIRHFLLLSNIHNCTVFFFARSFCINKKEYKHLIRSRIFFLLRIHRVSIELWLIHGKVVLLHILFLNHSLFIVVRHNGNI